MSHILYQLSTYIHRNISNLLQIRTSVAFTISFSISKYSVLLSDDNYVNLKISKIGKGCQTMLRGFVDAVKNLSAVAVKMMFYGTETALGIIIIGVLSYLAYAICLGGGYYCTSTCITLIRTGVSIFVLFMLGGITFDCVEKRQGRK